MSTYKLTLSLVGIKIVTMLPIQCKMARTALQIGVRELAKLAGVSTMTVSRFETGKDSYSSSVKKIKDALVSQGIIFIPQNGGGPGVRLKDSLDTDQA